MGLLIHTSFETQQGFSVSSVYLRITRFTLDPLGGGQYIITVKTETHLDRDRRLQGKLPLVTPGIPELISLQGELRDMAYLYALLKTNLESSGFTVENVDPDPEPTPSEPAPSEPAPSEPTPSEPTPSEPTPAPEASP